MYGGQIEKEFQVASVNRNEHIERHIPSNDAPARNSVVAQLKAWMPGRRQPVVVSERGAVPQTMRTAH